MSRRLAAFALQDFKVADQSVSVIVCAFDIADAKLATDHIESAEARLRELEAANAELQRKFEQAHTALREIEQHHIELNNSVGRDPKRSKIIEIARRGIGIEEQS